MQPAGRIDPPAGMTAPETRAVVSALSAEAAEVRFVGGCVRDALLGRDSQDIDLATTDAPDRVMELLARAGLRALPTGIAHGTVTALSGGRHYEVTTLRRDVETYGRHAKVAFTDDWAEDAARRDFTMNALYADIDGTLYDPTGGRSDLAAGRVRFVGNAALRIREDALRILRFFRFHARYGNGAPDAEGLAASAAAAPMLDNLSGERIAGEMLKLLRAAAAPQVLRVMADAGVLAHVVPDAVGFDRLQRLVALESAHHAADSVRRLASILPLDVDGARRLAERLRLSNAERDRLLAAVAPPPGLSAGMDAAAARRAIHRLGAERFRDLALLAWAQDPAAERWRDHLALADTWNPPVFPIKGEDVLALGLASGPRVGQLLDTVTRWWEEGDFRADRAGCLEKLRELAAV
jgi:poly(A) polymerase